MNSSLPIIFEKYRPEMSAECIELEKICPVVADVVIQNCREVFHKYYERFNNWEFIVARHNGKIVGFSGWTVKDIFILGENIKGILLLSTRVHPSFRRIGIASQLNKEFLLNILMHENPLIYGELSKKNQASYNLGIKNGRLDFISYDLLIWIVHKEYAAKEEVYQGNGQENHQIFWDKYGPFDFYSNPFQSNNLNGYYKTVMIKEAGCSIWSNEGICDIIITKTPFYYKFIRFLLHISPWKEHRNMKIPEIGKVLKEWYIFDFWADNTNAARSLMKQINNLAIKQNVNFINVICTKKSTWKKEVQKQNGRLFTYTFSKILSFKSPNHKIEQINNPYIDIRDCA